MTKTRFDMIIKHIDWEKLTDWEEGFLVSVEKQFKRKGYLTEPQEEIVERIWKERQ